MAGPPQSELRDRVQAAVLAYESGAGWGGDILLPSDSDYERLKYSTQDHLLLGTPAYFCTAADAEAHGYQRAPRYSPPS